MTLNPFGFAKSTIILLVMQPLDSFIQMRLRRSFRSLFRKSLQTVSKGPGIPVLIPQANAFAEKMGKQFNGIPLTSLTEIFLNVPTTAHILGGAVMAANRDEGVIDGKGRVFGYRNMYVCDGSMVSANLGVNPSLSITALSEYVMDQIKPDWHN